MHESDETRTSCVKSTQKLPIYYFKSWLALLVTLAVNIITVTTKNNGE